MKSYTIYYTLSGSIEIDASSAEEALELFENLSEDEIKDNAELEDYELDPDDYNDSEDE